MEHYNKMLKERISELLEKTEDTLLLEEVFCRLRGEQSAHIGAHPKHYGFGQWHTGREWAGIAGIPHNTFRGYLGKGMTVEEIFKLKNCPEPSSK